MNRRTVLSLSALAALTLGLVALAGPINPPAGPIVPTNKTLQEIFDKAGAAEARTAINATNTPGDADSVFKITAPGSYYLTGNITGAAFKHGIEITASGVTIDLNGFDLLGVPSSFDGISVTAVANNISVFNGSIRSWGNEGIDLGNFAVPGGRVERITCSGNGTSGIRIGPNSTVSHCSAISNATGGFSAGAACTFHHCTASGNGTVGFFGGDAATLANCTAASNAGNGFQVGDNASITNCSSVSNTGAFGFSTLVGATFVNCSAGKNASSVSPSAGFTTTGGSTFVGCTSSSNSSTASGTSAAMGFSIGIASVIRDCVTSTNKGDGIAAVRRCVISGNNCGESGFGGDGAGIHVTEGDNRIEGNACSISDRGIDVGAAGNLIIRNTCTANTNNWVIVANNVYGPILDRTAPASAAVVAGATAAASTLATTDPHANFTY